MILWSVAMFATLLSTMVYINAQFHVNSSDELNDVSTMVKLEQQSKGSSGELFSHLLHRHIAVSIASCHIATLLA